jgi:hypothetical protein
MEADRTWYSQREEPRSLAVFDVKLLFLMVSVAESPKATPPPYSAVLFRKRQLLMVAFPPTLIAPPAEQALLLVKTTESATRLVPEPVLIAPPLKLVKPPGQKPVRELKVGCA